MSQAEVLALLPFAIVVGLAIAVILVDLFWPRRDAPILAIGIGGLVLALVATVAIGPLPWDFARLEGPASVGATTLYTRDLLTVLLDVVLIAIGLLTLLFAPDYLAPRKLPLPEFTATLLFAVSGGMLIAGGQDLLILFIGLELLVLPGYLLAGFAKRDGLSTEGAIKYFLLGSFSSAILLFGLAFLFGFTGSTQLAGVAEVMAGVMDGSEPLPLALALALALVAVGLLFKIAAVPFHYWTPDAYQGSPTPVTGYLSTGPKIAAFALILRLLVEGLGPLRGEWAIIIGVLAAVTMTAGNLAALGQDNIKRMLAYSAIAHTGYIMVGLVVFAMAADEAIAADGIQGVLFYGFVYAFMNLGAFAVVAALQRRPGVTSQIASFSGLGFRAPVLALTMTVFLLSLTGIPPLAGFFAKAIVVLGALEVGGGLTFLAVLMMLNAAMAAFYYLRIVVVMYMRTPPEGAASVRLGGLTQAGLVVAATATILVGLFPPVTEAVLRWTEAAALALVGH